MVKAVVGANWGDEGKGKITDMLAEKADIIVRFQGGANAGHTIVNNYGKFALHTLPSGVFYNHTTSVIGNGVALNIPILMKEIKSITDRNVPMPKILVSDRAQMVMPYHILFDQYEEERLGGKSFGSTKSGIAPVSYTHLDVYKRQMVLGDEVLTPDSSRFWPVDGYEPGHGQPSFDKQFARDWLKANPEKGWKLPEEIVEKTIGKYLQAYKMLTGKDL